MKEKYIISTRGKVFFWINDLESDLAIIFLHGLTADHHLFDKQVEEFEKKYKLISIDWPLHGKSRPYKDFTYDNVSLDIKAILDQENVKQVVIVGQSAGGYIGQSFIRNYSEMVAGFIGIGTTPFGEVYYKSSDLFWLKHFSAIARLYPYSYYCKVSAKSITVTEEARKSMYETLLRLDKADMLRASKCVYDEFLKDLSEVNLICPVLLTVGQFDKTGYVKKYNLLWAENKKFQLEVIKNASHNANYDNYKDFNVLLDKFMISINNQKILKTQNNENILNSI